MPRTKPIPSALREDILLDIRGGILGRNAIARAHGVSTGTVTNIARAAGAFFPRCANTAAATRARKIDLALARVERETELWEIYLATPARRDGTEPRRARRASYALYDIHRKHRP